MQQSLSQMQTGDHVPYSFLNNKNFNKKFLAITPYQKSHFITEVPGPVVKNTEFNCTKGS